MESSEALLCGRVLGGQSQAGKKSSLPWERGGGIRRDKEVQVVTSGVMIGRYLQMEYLRNSRGLGVMEAISDY